MPLRVGLEGVTTASPPPLSVADEHGQTNTKERSKTKRHRVVSLPVAVENAHTAHGTRGSLHALGCIVRTSRGRG